MTRVDRTDDTTAVRAVACPAPWCKARAGRPCRTRAGHPTVDGEMHGARWLNAQREHPKQLGYGAPGRPLLPDTAATLTLACRYCEAPAGAACVSRSGSKTGAPVRTPHAARRSAAAAAGLLPTTR